MTPLRIHRPSWVCENSLSTYDAFQSLFFSNEQAQDSDYFIDKEEKYKSAN
jgi:hypothetical protein